MVEKQNKQLKDFMETIGKAIDGFKIQQEKRDKEIDSRIAGIEKTISNPIVRREESVIDGQIEGIGQEMTPEVKREFMLKLRDLMGLYKVIGLNIKMSKR